MSINVTMITAANREAEVQKLKEMGYNDKQISLFLQDGKITPQELEDIQPQNPNNVVEQTSTSKLTVDSVVTKLAHYGVTRDDLINLLNESQITVSQTGDFELNKEQLAKLNEGLSKLVESKQPQYLKIDNDSDSQTVEEMVEKGVIKRNNDGTYTILDKERLQKDYFTKIENESTVPNQSVNIDFDAEVTTDSVEKAVTPKSGNLHKDKTARNEFRKDVTDFIKNEYLTNPDKEEEIRTFVAENKYSKQIAKKTTKLNGELKTPRQVLQHYHEKYANADEKKAIGDVVKAVQNLDVDFLETFSGNVDNKKLLKAYNKVTGENLDRLPNDKLDDAKKYFAITALIDTVNSKQTHEGNKYKIQDFINDPNIRKEVAYEFLCAQDGFNKDGIINRIATLEVMGTKLSEKDKEYYTKHQSKLMLEKEIEEQNKDNFVVCYSKKQAKALEKNNIDPNNEFIVVDKETRKLIEQCPTEFGEPCAENGADFKGADGEFYKLSSDKYKSVMRKFTSKDGTQAGMAEDTFMTNTEADAGWQQVKLMAYDKETKSYIQKTPEQLLSHKNILFHRNKNKTSNGERNSLRTMVGYAGYPVDENHTLEKRVGAVALGTGLGAVSGAAFGALGVWASGWVSTMGTAAAQTITQGYTATGNGTTVTTQGQTVNTEGKVVTHTFKYYVDGEEFSRTIDHYIPPESIEVPGQTINVPGETITGEVKVDVPERPVNTQGKPTWTNYRDAMEMTGAAGALAGGGSALANAHNITDLGTLNDGTIRNQKHVVKTTQGNVRLNLNTKQTVTVLSNSKEVSKDNPDITWTAQFSEKRKMHSDGNLHNMVDDKMAAVNTAYNITNANDQKLIYDFIMKHNNLADFKGKKQYTNNLQYNFPKYVTKDMIPGLSQDYEIPTDMINGSSISLSNLEQVDIILTNGAYNGRNGKSTPTSTKRTVHVRGTAYNI